jgi:hypothetical protein
LAAWEAVTASDLNRLLSFLAAREHRLPFLRRGLLALLHHCPDLNTGLNAWEYQLLRLLTLLGETKTLRGTYVHLTIALSEKGEDGEGA